MKKVNIKAIIMAMAIIPLLVSCEKEYESESLPNNQLSGEWYVQTYFGGNVVLGYERIVTSNTASANGSEMWVDDLGHIWPFKVKANITGSNTFSVNAGENIQWPTFDTIMQTTTITRGEIFPDKGRSATGVVVDSIYIEAEFSDDPGSTYIMAGHYRTGFVEDDF